MWKRSILILRDRDPTLRITLSVEIGFESYQIGPAPDPAQDEKRKAKKYPEKEMFSSAVSRKKRNAKRRREKAYYKSLDIEGLEKKAR